ncbi:MAG: disulfide oxidoreductase [Candidatus Pacebacteria bacterium]|nr:disulfide oxidoreductase [Candidatus Paceibacterota bacterium]
MPTYIKQLPASYWLYKAWIVSILAMLGSLYFSEILKFAPCVLCWYQRIAIYPLVAILAVGILKKDRGVHFYALPLAIFGLIVSIYQNLLYWNIIPENLAPCVAGVSCTTRYIEYFGFITIPLLALVALVIIIFSLFMFRYRTQMETSVDSKI